MRYFNTACNSAFCLLLGAILVIGCGDDSGSSPTCENHIDCADNEVCDADTSLCIPNVCGDGVARDGEGCDEGIANGVSPAACMTDCTLTICGDGYLGGNEVCDGSVVEGATCQSEIGHTSGDLECGTNCDYVVDDCYTCGDGSLDGPEICDGADLGGAICTDHGFDGGALDCGSDCLSVDTANCTTCGDGVCETEFGESTLACAADCGWVNIAVGLGTLSGGSHTCGVKADGTVWCWGENDFGQLGNGTYDATSIPVQVALIDDGVAVSLGEYHSCALTAAGDIHCWGANFEGQLGVGSNVASTIPVAASLTAPAVSVDAGREHSCAVLDDAGQLSTVCWGLGGGRLGTGQPFGSNYPVVVTTPMSGVSAGFTHSCGINAVDSTAYCWGINIRGQLGDGTTDPALDPVQVVLTNLPMVAQVGAGDEFSCALLSSGTVSCWGRNQEGSLGTQTSNWQLSLTPVNVDGLGGTLVNHLSVGRYSACVINDANAAFCWGGNNFGQLGDGTTDAPSPPHAVAVSFGSPTGVYSIDTGFGHTCAVTVDGQALCWGLNSHGQLGDANVGGNVLSPTLVADPYL